VIIYFSILKSRLLIPWAKLGQKKVKKKIEANLKGNKNENIVVFKKDTTSKKKKV
jgi:hypothetical protein